MTYIVTWVLAYAVSVPCPDYKPDEYGRYPSATCMVMHTKQIEEEKSKEFRSLEEAKKFVENGEMNSTSLYSLRPVILKDFKINKKSN